MGKAVARCYECTGPDAECYAFSFKPDLIWRSPRRQRIMDVASDLASLDILSESEARLKYSGAGREYIMCGSFHRESSNGRTV
jgi:hypothetical protein